ncbi:MAG: hypothetical protein LHV69_05295 [Elusimicrobia bacterium]|nr:hypothetical protein [Candidatus Obscuribacterium magneticum]
MDVIRDIRTKPLDVRLHDPFVTALGRKTISKNLTLNVITRSGLVGQGEASASLALPQETRAAMADWMGRVKAQLIGLGIKDLKRRFRLKHFLQKPDLRHPTALGALESALLDLMAKAEDKSPASYFGNKTAPVQTDITLSAWDQNETLRIAKHNHRIGFRRFKIKVGRAAIEADLERINTLSHRFPDCELWIDANQGFDERRALKFIETAKGARWKIKGLEQPTPKKDFDLLRRIRRKSPFPVYADESAGTLADVKRLTSIDAVDGFVIKIAKSGLLQAIEMVRWARARRKKTMISCMAESARGLAVSVQWAIGDGKFDWVDLDSYALTKTKVPADFYRTDGPWLSLA